MMLRASSCLTRSDYQLRRGLGGATEVGGLCLGSRNLAKIDHCVLRMCARTSCASRSGPPRHSSPCSPPTHHAILWTLAPLRCGIAPKYEEAR